MEYPHLCHNITTIQSISSPGTLFYCTTTLHPSDSVHIIEMEIGYKKSTSLQCKNYSTVSSQGTITNWPLEHLTDTLVSIEKPKDSSHCPFNIIVGVGLYLYPEVSFTLSVRTVLSNRINPFHTALHDIISLLPYFVDVQKLCSKNQCSNIYIINMNNTYTYYRYTIQLQNKNTQYRYIIRIQNTHT